MPRSTNELPSQIFNFNADKNGILTIDNLIEGDTVKGMKHIKQTLIDISMDIDYYLEKDPTASSKWHIILFSAGFHGLLLYRISTLLWKNRLGFLARGLHLFSRIVYSMDIHPAARVEGGVVIDHGVGVVIGSTASVGTGTLIYHGVTLGSKNVMKGKRHPDIGRNVVLGAGAKILGPIYVGDNSKVGANSVVIEHVPQFSIVTGIPGRIHRVCERLGSQQ